MLPIVALLLEKGLSLAANAVLAKGKDWVQEKTGIDLSEPEPELTPEQLTQIKQWELENETELAKLRLEDNKLDLEVFRTEMQDRASARDREVAMAKLSTAPWWVPSITTVLALIVVIGGGYMFFTIEDKDSRYVIIATVTSVLGFYFGTTQRSGKKDEAIERLAGGAK